ncbi:MAG: hypothetical protein JJE39_05825 [Vicinamibacteria bacterium]|nr:hypothetical protein [Vicinamibacteria bacterium]
MNEGKKRRKVPTSEAKAIKPGPPPVATDGLNDLDQERAASVADEGGVTAAALESQATVERNGTKKL